MNSEINSKVSSKVSSKISGGMRMEKAAGRSGNLQRGVAGNPTLNLGQIEFFFYYLFQNNRILAAIWNK